MEAQSNQNMQQSVGDMHAFVEDLKSRAVFENLATLVTKCTRQCAKNYDQMYLEPEEENCVKSCYLKSFEFQTHLNQELAYLVRNL